MVGMAEAVRFELTDGCPSPVFKTGAIDHSATLPRGAILPLWQQVRYAAANSPLRSADVGAQVGLVDDETGRSW
jgi:hypothetical protein